MRIEHITIWSDDIDRLKRFYELYFSARANDKYTNHSKGFSSYFLEFESGCRLEVMQMPGIEFLPDRDKQYHGIAHLAVSVGSRSAVDSLTERIRGDGYAVVGEPRTTGDGYYERVVLDPDGNRIEITI